MSNGLESNEKESYILYRTLHVGIEKNKTDEKNIEKGIL